MKIGDKLHSYEKPSGRSGEIKEHTVHSIGKKYIYIERYNGEKDLQTPISKIDLRYHSHHSSNYDKQFYTSVEEISDMLEMQDLLGSVRKVFQYYQSSDLTLEQLRQINDIITLNITHHKN